MTNKERISVNLLHYQAENYMQEICNMYYCCVGCPYSIKHSSTVFLGDGTSFTTGCAQNVLHKVFEYNISKEVIE